MGDRFGVAGPGEMIAGDVVGCGYHWDFCHVFWTKNGKIVAWEPISTEVGGFLHPCICSCGDESIEINIARTANPTYSLDISSNFNRDLARFIGERNSQRLATGNAGLQRQTDEDSDEEKRLERRVHLLASPHAVPGAPNSALKLSTLWDRFSSVSFEPFYQQDKLSRFQEDLHSAVFFGLQCPCAKLAVASGSKFCHLCVYCQQLRTVDELQRNVSIPIELPDVVDTMLNSLPIATVLPATLPATAKVIVMKHFLKQRLSSRALELCDHYLSSQFPSPSETESPAAVCVLVGAVLFDTRPNKVHLKSIGAEPSL